MFPALPLTRLTRLTRPGAARALIAVAAAALGACHSSSVTSTVPVVTTIAATAGVADQHAPVAQPLPNPIQVIVEDQNGTAMSGIVVTWRVAGKGGTVDSVTSTTNSSGEALTHWTLGTTAGVDTLTATTPNGRTATITATGTPGAVAAVAKVSGDNQSVAVGAASQPLVAKAVDRYGNGIAGLGIFFSTNGGTLSASLVPTDASGQAQVTLTPGAAGTWTVTASLGSLPTTAFTVTAH